MCPRELAHSFYINLRFSVARFGEDEGYFGELNCDWEKDLPLQLLIILL